MKTVTKWLFLSCTVIAIALFFACSKSNSSGPNPNIPAGKSQVSIYMMDDPIQFTKVLIDIRQVAVLVDTSSKQTDADEEDEWNDDFCGRHGDRDHKKTFWDTLNIKPGVYDLLKLRNGVDTSLATGLIPSGKILKIRITLGSDNTIFTDSTTSYPLEVFGPHPYFTINVRGDDVAAPSSNDFKLWLDFNLSKSIWFWSGTYFLRPWIVVFNDEMEGKIQGQVLPEWASPLVTAISTKDTLYAIPNEDGRYKFRGVNAGTYALTFKGHGGYHDSTVNNIVVNANNTTQVPTVTLHK